jgi:hypothetical protein
MQQNTIETESPVYNNLDEIRLRKAQLLTDIAKDNNRMRKMWDSLFHKRSSGKKTPSKRFSGLLSTGAGVLDGALLAWKLYRKFKR